MSRLNQLSRRTILKGAGAAMALPLLDCMAQPASAKTQRKDPPRLACIYVPGGLARPYWYPNEDGPKYSLSPSLEPLANHRDQFTLIRGLQHIAGQVGGHLHHHNWLTGHNVTDGTNSISMDQVFAQHFGTTYCETLVLSFNDGVGSYTASRNALGADIPAIGNPARALQQLLPPVDRSQLSAMKRRLHLKKTVVDGVNEQLKSFNAGLGSGDRQRMEQFTESLHGLEQRIGFRQQAIDTPRPDVDEDRFPIWETSRSGDGSLADHMKVMTDLMVLGFQTDTTRVSTYMTGQDDGGGPKQEVYDYAKKLGVSVKGGHQLWHSGSKATKQEEDWSKLLHMRDKLLVQGVAKFIEKLQAIPAVEGTLLDHTQILLGGMQGHTHRASDGPTLVAGGKQLGWKHGQYKVYWKPAELHGGDYGRKSAESPRPLSNLYLTMLQQAGCTVDSFKESTGTLSELLV